MLLLSVAELTKHFGPDPVLDGASFEMRAGQKISLIGPNGSGKSTLLKIITGQLEADKGQVTLHPGTTIGYLQQHIELAAGKTVWEEASSALGHLKDLDSRSLEIANQIADSASLTTKESAELEAQYDRLQHKIHQAGAYNLDHKIDRILRGLSFDDAAINQPVETLSGGQQNRLMLAKLLLQEPDILLLDEPSNHLDIDATEWLESFLVSSEQAVLLVSHDRYLLDKVAQQTLELVNGSIDAYKGNYTAYLVQKEQRLEVQRRTWERQREEIARLEEFVRKHKYGQKHVQAEDRQKKLERIELVDRPRTISAPSFGFPEPGRTGDIVLRVEHLSKAYDHQLFKDLTFDVIRGESWGILGPNGTGKSTLLKCLIGEVQADDGTVHIGTGVKRGYLDQQLSCVDPKADVVDAVRPDHKEFFEKQRRDLLARFGIQDDMVFQKVSSLSGGERSRTALARIAAADANLLIFDEPTNHLDLWARESLEKSLRAFEGTMIVVSHDRYFLNHVVDHLLVVQHDRFHVIQGNYTTYQTLEQAGLAQEARDKLGNTKSATKSQSAGSKHPNPGKPKPQKETKKNRKFPYRKVPELEQDIAKCELRIEELFEFLSLEQTLRDGELIKKYNQELQEIQSTLEQLYEHLEESLELN
ncbi:MAG: ABC-F family ATP-binding cassette domain-containing protein [Pirellulaceae bacterium]